MILKNNLTHLNQLKIKYLMKIKLFSVLLTNKLLKIPKYGRCLKMTLVQVK